MPLFQHLLFPRRFRDSGGDGGDGGGGGGGDAGGGDADGGDSGVGIGGDSGDTGAVDSGIGFGGGTMGALGLDGAMDSASSPESSSTIGDTSQADVASFAQMDAQVDSTNMAAALGVAPNAPSNLGIASAIAGIFGGLLGLLGAPVAGTMASIAGRGMSVADSLGIQGTSNLGSIGNGTSASGDGGDTKYAPQSVNGFNLTRPVLSKTVYKNGQIYDLNYLGDFLKGLQMSDAQDKQSAAPNVPAQQALAAGGSTSVTNTNSAAIPTPVILAAAAALVWFVFKGKD